MARPSYHRLFNHQRILKLVMVLVGFCLACCILGPPLYWHFKGSSRAQTSCGSCDCGCDSDITLSITLGENHSFYIVVCVHFL